MSRQGAMYWWVEWRVEMPNQDKKAEFKGVPGK
jgi:hypothetical protein